MVIHPLNINAAGSRNVGTDRVAIAARPKSALAKFDAFVRAVAILILLF